MGSERVSLEIGDRILLCGEGAALADTVCRPSEASWSLAQGAR
jgi:hypothetical protein